MSKAFAAALAACAVSAIAEGVLSGSGVKARLGALRMPRFSPPLWAWGGIGLFYYLLCFVVVRGVLEQAARGPVWYATLGSVLTMMAANAIWNYIFFRKRDLQVSLMFFVGYDVLASVVFGLLLLSDRRLAWPFLVYLVYLVYATVWAHGLWKANLQDGAVGEQPDDGCRGPLTARPMVARIVNSGPDLEEVRALFGEYAESVAVDLSFQGFSEELAGLPGDYVAPDGTLLLCLA